MFSLEERQMEVEKKFSRESIFDELAIQSDLFYGQMDSGTVRLAGQIVDDDPYEVLSAMIILLGSPERDKKIMGGDFHREVEVEALIKGLARYVKRDCYKEKMNISMQLVAEMDTILYDIEYKRIETNGEFTTIPYAQVFFTLDLSSATLPHFTSYKLPMLCKPRDWDSEGGGYLLGESKPGLNKAEQNQPSQVFETLNKSQHQAYRLVDGISAESLFQYVYAKMKIKYNERKSVEIAQNMAQSADFAFQEMKDKNFYFEWKFDFRNRKYCSGYDINWQGDSYRKACLIPIFEHTQEVNDSWRFINIANEAGFDKLSFDERISKGRELGLVSVKKMCRISQQGLINAIEQPQPVVRLDATQQALQLYAVLLRCKQVGSTCNVASGDVCADAYQMLADSLNKFFGKDLFTRKDCKKALMVSLYAKMNAHMEIVDSWIGQGKATDLADFAFKTGDVFDENGDLEKLSVAFSNALYDIAPSAVRMMNLFLKIADKNAKTYTWIMPNGFIVKYDVKKKVKFNGETKSKGGKMISFKAEKVVYEASEFNRGLAPNVIHSVDAYVRSEVERRMGNSFIETNHDEFAVFTYDCRKVGDIYREVLCEILESNLLEDIISQITTRRVTMPFGDDLTRSDIVNSMYTLS